MVTETGPGRSTKRLRLVLPMTMDVLRPSAFRTPITLLIIATAVPAKPLGRVSVLDMDTVPLWP